MKIAGWTTLIGVAALAGCMSAREDAGTAAAAGAAVASPAASADIRNAAGRSIARATASQMADSVRVAVEASGMPPGAYAAHIHSVGRCDPPGFESAGPHWNPAMRQHGKDNPQGLHKGDLPNLTIGTDGRGSFEISIPTASLRGGPGGPALLDADGAALVIHAKPDDYRTDPTGNAGGRMACGVFG